MGTRKKGNFCAITAKKHRDFRCGKASFYEQAWHITLAHDIALVDLFAVLIEQASELYENKIIVFLPQNLSIFLNDNHLPTQETSTGIYFLFLFVPRTKLNLSHRSPASSGHVVISGILPISPCAVVSVWVAT